MKSLIFVNGLVEEQSTPMLVDTSSCHGITIVQENVWQGLQPEDSKDNILEEMNHPMIARSWILPNEPWP